MVATVVINEKNGAGESATNKTGGTIRFRANDSPAVDAANPIVIPDAGSAYSFEKWLRLNAGGTFNELTNLKLFTDGTDGIGTDVVSGIKTEVSYTQPALGSSLTGFTDAFTYTEGSPLSLGAGPYLAAGDVGSYAVMLMQVGTSALPGNSGVEALTYQYDES